MIALKFARKLPAVLAAVMLAGALGGCVSLLPKAKPAQLYRFGWSGTDAGEATIQPRGVTLGEVVFPHEAMTDGILTMRGGEAGYIAGARWVSPAMLLFREAVPAAFDQPSSRTRVLTRGAVGLSAGVLGLEVARFETDYDRGDAPTAVVIVRARLSSADGRLLGMRNFDVRKPASANRVSAIVPAMNTATNEALSQIVAWTDQSLDAAPPPSAPVVERSTTTSTTSATSSTSTHQRR